VPLPYPDFLGAVARKPRRSATQPLSSLRGSDDQAVVVVL
jgi:hypothetical protein